MQQHHREKTSFLIKDILDFPSVQQQVAREQEILSLASEFIKKPTPIKLDAFPCFPAELLLLREGFAKRCNELLQKENVTSLASSIFYNQTLVNQSPNQQASVSPPMHQQHVEMDDNLSESEKLSSALSKCRRSRTVFTELQLLGLEKKFESNKYLSTAERTELAHHLHLTQLQVKTWYQNRRMKWKKHVMMSGATECPTKPKGRPRKNSYYPNNHISASPLNNSTIITSVIAPVNHQQSSDDDSMDQDSLHWQQNSLNRPNINGHNLEMDQSSHSSHRHLSESDSRPESPTISVTD